MEILFSGEKEEKDITISDFIKEENLRNSEEDSKQTEDSKEKEDKYIGEFGGYRSKNVNLINPVPQETSNSMLYRCTTSRQLSRQGMVVPYHRRYPTFLVHPERCACVDANLQIK